MTVDLDQLSKEALELDTELSNSRSSRERTGTTKAIRAALSEIYKLRERGVRWSAIAAALAAQGIVQGKDRSALTANRLTALVRQIELQNEKRALKRTAEVTDGAPKRIATKNRHATSSPKDARTSGITHGVRHPAARSRQASKAVDFREEQSGPAPRGDRKIDRGNGDVSRKRNAHEDRSEIDSRPSKRGMKSAEQSNREVLAFMDRAKAVRQRRD